MGGTQGSTSNRCVRPKAVTVRAEDPDVAGPSTT